MVDPTIGTIVCGLGCALTWGAGDFSGGVATKNGDVFRVVLVSQIIGWTALIACALSFGEPMPPPDRLVYGAGTGPVFLKRGLVVEVANGVKVQIDDAFPGIVTSLSSKIGYMRSMVICDHRH